MIGFLYLFRIMLKLGSFTTAVNDACLFQPIRDQAQFRTILKVLLEADSFLSTYLPNGLGARIVNIQQI